MKSCNLHDKLSIVSSRCDLATNDRLLGLDTGDNHGTAQKAFQTHERERGCLFRSRGDATFVKQRESCIREAFLDMCSTGIWLAAAQSVQQRFTSLHVGVERPATAEIDLVEWLLCSESLV